MATHSGVLAWRIPGTGEPGGLPSLGSHRVGHDRSDLAAAAASRPAKTFPTDTLLSVFYTIIIPVLNPLIYSLRNSELTYAMKMLWRRNIVSHIN